jgi:phosphatidylinositol alpha-mannosyltransferase
MSGAPLRVGMFSPYSLSVPGGVQGQVLGLAAAMRSSGHQVQVLGPCDGAPPGPGVIPLGPSLPTAANGSIAPIAPGVSTQLRTIHALRDESFDVIHLHEPMVPGPTQTALLMKPVPVVATFHAAGESAAYRWLGPLVRRAAGRIDVRCVVSEDARAMAEAALGGTYEVLFNGVDVGAYDDGEAWPTGAPTVLFLGRHEPRKGLATLLEAMDRLGGSIRVWVAGDGPETDELRARWSGPRVEWLGRIDEEEKAARLRGADVFCAPSLRGESFGIVLLEAMAARTPVVASDLSGYSNVARAGRDALLVPPGDAAALATGIDQALAGGAAIDAMVESGLDRARELSLDALADRYVDLYRRAITGSRDTS